VVRPDTRPSPGRNPSEGLSSTRNFGILHVGPADRKATRGTDWVS
jgi:hypothetical protein